MDGHILRTQHFGVSVQKEFPLTRNVQGLQCSRFSKFSVHGSVGRTRNTLSHSLLRS